MSKRKWEEISRRATIPNGHPDAAVGFQRRQLEGLLEQGKRALSQSLEFARYPERQKLSRRQKTAKTENNEAEIARLDAEVAALKKLEPAKTAELHVYRSLLKIKSVASHPAFPHYVQTTVEAARKPLDTAHANVQARLFKSAPVQTAMTATLKDIRAILAIPEIKEGKKKRLRANDFDNGTSTKASTEAPTSRKEQAPEKTDSEWEGLSNLEPARHSNASKNSDSDEHQYSIYASRLAASSDESSDSDSDPNPSNHQQLNPDSITEEDSETDSEDSPPSNPKPPKKSTPTSTTTALPKSTTFLPSLSTSGYYPGSASSSASDISDTEPQVRKNRRGQQARRALWEKKFGKNANHLKNETVDRDEGWDARRGARGADERGKRGRGRGRGGLGGLRGERGGGGGRGRGRGPISSGANSGPVAVRKGKAAAAANGPLHPSWEAAKKAKEKKQTVAFEGKKVVFS